MTALITCSDHGQCFTCASEDIDRCLGFLDHFQAEGHFQGEVDADKTPGTSFLRFLTQQGHALTVKGSNASIHAL